VLAVVALIKAVVRRLGRASHSSGQRHDRRQHRSVCRIVRV